MFVGIRSTSQKIPYTTIEVSDTISAKGLLAILDAFSVDRKLYKATLDNKPETEYIIWQDGDSIEVEIYDDYRE